MNLGCVFAIGIYVRAVAAKHYGIFGIYMCVMAIFHFTEYLTIAIIHPSLVSVDSFVINHSPQYTIAAISSWLEFALESYFFPGKQFTLTSIVNVINLVIIKTTWLYLNLHYLMDNDLLVLFQASKHSIGFQT